MKDDITTILEMIVMWVLGLAMSMATFFLLGLFAKLAWVPFQYGWNLVF